MRAVHFKVGAIDSSRSPLRSCPEQHLGLFYALLFAVSMCMQQLFRLLSSTLASPIAAQAVVGLVLLFLLVLCGFIVPMSQTPGYMIWITYLNPIYYTYQGTSVLPGHPMHIA